MNDPAKRPLLEESLMIREELRRRAESDPLRRFELFPIQQKFATSVLRGTKAENWYVGANRSGKSDAGAYVGANLARFGDQSDDVKWVQGKGSNVAIRDRATSGWVVSLDFPSSRDIIQPKYFDNGFVPPNATHMPFIPAHEIDAKGWRVSDQVLKLRNGSIIGFKSADSGRLKFQGTEKNWVHFDEEPPEPIYEECGIRVGNRPLKIFGTCTLLPPEGVIGGITWLFNKKIKPWQRGERGVGIFNASIFDNPYISRDEINRLESIYPPGSVQHRIRILGELIGGFAGARIYASFHPMLNTRPFTGINPRRPLAWIWDFNVEPMITLVGQRVFDCFEIHREIILEEGSIMEMVDEFKRLYPSHQAEIWLYGDATGQERSHQTKLSSYQIILNGMLGYPAPVRMKVPEANPSVFDRINAVNRACKNEQGLINLLVDPDECPELVSDFEQVLSDGKGGIKKTFNRKDPYFRRTHASDALGYWIALEAPVTSMRSEERRPSVVVPKPGYRRGGGRLF